MGKYKKRLYKIFVILSIILVSIIMFLMGLSFFEKQKNKYTNTIHQTSIMKNNSSDFAINIIMNALTEFSQTAQLDQWLTTKDSPDYYYNSLKIYHNLRRLSSNLSLLDYEISVASLDEDTSVISQNGTYNKDVFFKTETSLTDEQVNDIHNHFEHNNTPLTLTSYEDNKLNSIYYITRHKDTNRAIFIVKIPYKTLFGPDDEQDFIIHDGQNLIASNGIEPSQDKLSDYIMLNSEQQNSEPNLSYFEDSIIFYTGINILGWRISYIYENISLDFASILIYFVVPTLVLIGLALITSKLIIDTLYSPIKELMSEIVTKDEKNLNIDEFELLKQNTYRLSKLNRQLQDTITENNLLVSQKFYRGLLIGNDVDPDMLKALRKNDKDYCVALIEFQSTHDTFTNDEIFFYKNNLYSKSLEFNDAQYINISHNTCALILQVNDFDKAKSIVLKIINTVNELINIKISISDVRYGIDHIHTNFREARKILEYKHLYVNNEIITMKDVSSLVDSTYYYPLLTESRLMQSMVDGNQEALKIFDNLIKENIQNRNLSPSTLKNFLFMIIGTLNRVFQELKTSPKELLGQDLDFENLYSAWNNVNIIKELKQIIGLILEKVNDQKESLDDTLLNDMQAYIYQNYSDDIMLNDMAAAFNISPKYCSALFKKLSDDNFKSFLNRYRVDKAKEFLEADPEVKISDLGTRVGFNSASNFIRVFGKYAGVTPRAFADQIKNHKNKEL